MKAIKEKARQEMESKDRLASKSQKELQKCESTEGLNMKKEQYKIRRPDQAKSVYESFHVAYSKALP